MTARRRRGPSLRAVTLIASFALLPLAACGGGEEPKADPAGQPAAQPAEPASEEVPPPLLAEGKESAYSSNQWNSAVGLGGGAGGRFGGRNSADLSAESYADLPESGFLDVRLTALSTFAADVDTASYSNVRRYLQGGSLPPAGAVRIEELVNAFRYDDPEPKANERFALAAEVGRCPWEPRHHLLRLSLRTPGIDASKVPPCNLVFLIDVSGSMDDPAKLPLLVRSMGLLVDQLRPQDHVAIVTYANGVHVPLESARGDEKERIHAALAALQSGGSTAGAAGIQRAYEIAEQHQIPEGVNRVLLATDGDFNVGISSLDALHQFIAERKDRGVFLTVLGFGTGNLKDDKLETLANKGNGVYAYVDDLAEGRRVLVEQFGASMMTVAKDVKLQVEFNPRFVAGYRLLGYENRKLAAAEFKDDKKDGGELGAGHAVTALYEVVPAGVEVPGASAQPLKYQEAALKQDGGEELLTLQVRFKAPLAETSSELGFTVPMPAEVAERPSPRFWLAATAAAFGLQLRGSEQRGNLDWDRLAAMAEDLEGSDPAQAELAKRIEEARRLAKRDGAGAK